MEDFKLLGIRPRKGCHPKLVKNLQVGQIYQFYDGAKFYSGDNDAGLHSPVDLITFKDEVPDNLYKVMANGEEYPLRINISAVAGKNGSGKSSLVELFSAAIFVFAIDKGLITPTTSKVLSTLKYWEDELRAHKERQKELAKEKTTFMKAFDKQAIIQNTGKHLPAAPQNDKTILYDGTEAAIKKQLRLENAVSEKIEEAQTRIAENKARLAEYKKMAERVKVDLFYQVDETCYLLSTDVGSTGRSALYQLPKQKGGKPEEILNLGGAAHSDFLFYTIAVNYSHYSLNAKYLGDWIKLLFHKNDGYRTPLVLTPMRDDGNFDINDETGFARTRLLNNLLVTEMNRKEKLKEIKITDKQSISEVYFTLDKAKIGRIKKRITVDTAVRGERRALDLLEHFLKVAFENEPLANPLGANFALKETIFNYIVKKIDSITYNYTEFQPGFIWDTEIPHQQNERFLKKLLDDKTHVTYKLKQALNFLRYNMETEGRNRFTIDKADLKGNKIVRFHFSLPELLNGLQDREIDNIIPQLPPSIFEVDFKLTNQRGQSSWFSALSSGEQQYIHILQSILYHINNLQSAHADPDRIKYKALNIILDEIELYFHPDLQRRFISGLLDAFKDMNVRFGNEIKAINILFLTHSPFILSDIPTQNILRLKVGGKNGKALPFEGEFKTFAANIHELLAHSFFIDGTLMGKFAEDKIDSLIKKIRRSKVKELTEDEQKLLDLIGDSYLKSSINSFKKLQGYDQN